MSRPDPQPDRDNRAAVWRSAAVFGSLWAAVEIVAGSFLHNLRIPFAGSLLSAFGVALLTAAHRRVPERGLIWRSALICSLMKSISPSAVILGPMVGILMEGVLLESAVRVLGRRPVAYLAGGAMAVAWSLVQRILNTLLSYGTDVVRLYVETYNYAARVIGVSSFGPVDLIAALFVIELGIGMLAAFVGLRATRVGDRREVASLPTGADDSAGLRPTAEFRWSLPRLLLFATALVAGMFLLGSVPLAVGAVYVTVFSGVVLRTYPTAARRLRRVGLWIELASVMILAGLVLGGVRGGWDGMLNGLAAGATMVLRAALVLLGFTAVSVELRNPVILARLERRKLQGLSDALAESFGALPAFTAALASQWSATRRPSAFLGGLVDLAAAMAQPASETSGARVAILTGEVGSGKTTAAAAVVDGLRARGARVGGFLAVGRLAGGRRTGFDLRDVATGETWPLCRESAEPSGATRWNRFSFVDETLARGRGILAEAAATAHVIVVDEIGGLELSGGGWAPSLDALAREFRGTLVLVVRRSLVPQVRSRWGSAGAAVFDIGTDRPEAIADRISRRESGTGNRESVRCPAGPGSPPYRT